MTRALGAFHWDWLLQLAMALFAWGVVAPAWAEPSYCDPALFDEKRISIGAFEETEKAQLYRINAFQLGKVTLVGAAVGDSKTQSLVDLALRFAPHSKEKRYCTWYLNHPREGKEGQPSDGKPLSPKDLNRKEASQTFIHRDILKNPIEMSEDEAGQEFIKVLGPSFDQDPASFLSCAEDQHYIALGCNGMMHRGPTAFGMLLAFSGCTPSHALEITNQIWGLNGVRRKVRMKAIARAFELGSQRKASQKRLAELFSP